MLRGRLPARVRPVPPVTCDAHTAFVQNAQPRWRQPQPMPKAGQHLPADLRAAPRGPGGLAPAVGPLRAHLQVRQQLRSDGPATHSACCATWAGRRAHRRARLLRAQWHDGRIVQHACPPSEQLRPLRAQTTDSAPVHKMGQGFSWTQRASGPLASTRFKAFAPVMSVTWWWSAQWQPAAHVWRLRMGPALGWTRLCPRRTAQERRKRLARHGASPTSGGAPSHACTGTCSNRWPGGHRPVRHAQNSCQTPSAIPLRYSTVCRHLCGAQRPQAGVRLASSCLHDDAHRDLLEANKYPRYAHTLAIHLGLCLHRAWLGATSALLARDRRTARLRGLTCNACAARVTCV